LCGKAGCTLTFHGELSGDRHGRGSRHNRRRAQAQQRGRQERDESKSSWPHGGVARREVARQKRLQAAAATSAPRNATGFFDLGVLVADFDRLQRPAHARRRFL